MGESALLTTFLDADRELVLDWVRRQAEEPEEWRHTMSLMSGEHWLTAEEAGEVARALSKAIERYRERTRRHRPPGSRKMRVSALVVALPPEPGEAAPPP